MTGKVAGRTSDTELTLFRSLGLAAFDVAAAEHVVAKATASGAGVDGRLLGARRPPC